MRFSTILNLLIIILLLTSCTKEKAELPKVITTPITEVTWEYTISGGEVIDDGGSPIIARGICYTTDTSSLPTPIKNGSTNYTTDSLGIGAFTSKLFYFRSGAAGDHVAYTNYYLRAYATNKNGTAYGEVFTCFPKLRPPRFISMYSSNVTSTMATIYFDISRAYSSADEIDICYGTSPNPTIEGEHILISNLGMETTLENLSPNTTYYVRGYAINESGSAYSNQISFKTWEGSVNDASGNIYAYKTIGSQIWITRNLETTKFNDESIIPNVQDDLLWGYTSTSANCTYTKYGKLYNYYAVVDNRKLCPTGWHVPSDSDWKILETFLGMNPDQLDAIGLRGTDEGGKLKYTIISIYDGWNFPNTGATNSVGFSARGSGYRSDNGIFTNENISANFWSNSEFDANSAWGRVLNYNNSQIIRLNVKKGYGFSVRCLKD